MRRLAIPNKGPKTCFPSETNRGTQADFPLSRVHHRAEHGRIHLRIGRRRRIRHVMVGHSGRHRYTAFGLQIEDGMNSRRYAIFYLAGGI
jgi:hypothetical protein